MDKDEWKYLFERRHDLRVRAMTNRLYQQDRQHFMEMREGYVKVASLVLGSAVVVKLGNADLLQIIGAAAFAASASSLVFRWGTKANDAARRCSEWVSLERDIEAAGERDFTERQLADWFARCNSIEAGEPRPNARLLEKAYLATCKALGTAPREKGPRTLPLWLPPLVLP